AMTGDQLSAALPKEMTTGLDLKELGEIIARHRDSLYPETVTIDLDAAKRVEQSLIAAGLIKPGASMSGLHDTSIVGGGILRVRDLTISYGGDPVLEGAGLAVGDGSFVSLVGPSGSGKSSLLRAVIGLQQPLSGTVETDLARAQVGILFQDDALLPWKTARDNVALGLTFNGMERRKALAEADA